MFYRRLLTVLGPVLFLFSLLLPVDPKMAATVGAVLWMGAWWIGEVIPLAITALLPLVLAPIFGVMPAKEIAPNYAKSPVFLFLGGFLLAIGLQKYNLHRFLAHRILRIFGNSEIGLFLGVSLATYLLSMWISNTSSALIMIPLILSLEAGALTTALAFGVAYSATIGGIATLVGTPPNIMYAGVLRSYDINVSFTDWMVFGLPYSLFLELLFLIITVRWFRLGKRRVKVKVEEIKVDTRGRLVLIIFLITVTLWLTRSGLNLGEVKVPGWSSFVSGGDDSTVAILSSILLFLFGLIDWRDTKDVPWNALLLFGGGFALSHMIVKSGLSEAITEALRGFAHLHPMLVVGAWAIVTLVLTEFASNTSISAVLIPLAFSFAMGVGLDPKALAAVVAVAASGAFMLPVATPPNMLVYSFELVKLKDMIKLGLVMNVLAYLLAVFLAYRLAP
ncbi:MAG: SLC13/DASS family transporter [Thermotogae bacterium]|nr:SLC13/DASS family transporter [Thermotogota bacterium]